MLPKNKHFVKLQKKVAKKIEEKLGVSINKTLSSESALRYDEKVQEIHEITTKVATKYCEKHGLPAPVISYDGVKVLSGTFAGFVDSKRRYVIFNW